MYNFIKRFISNQIFSVPEFKYLPKFILGQTFGRTRTETWMEIRLEQLNGILSTTLTTEMQDLS